jgi:SAM-dependent methyltransferase
VISLNSFEHFPDPGDALAEMTSLLRPGGLLLITFGPPWFAPYGSHMHFFTRVPWVNLLFSEAVVMQVRQRYRPDGALRYEDVESGLNKMTVRRFEELVERSGLTLEHRAYRGIRGLNLLTRIPVLRELCTTNVAVILRRPASGVGTDRGVTGHS